MSDQKTFVAEYFDGRSSRRIQVQVHADEDFLHVQLEGGGARHPLASIVVNPRIGNAPQRIELPSGGVLLIKDFDTVASVLGLHRSRTLAHRLETHIPFVLASLAALVAIFWLGYRYAIPVGAEILAHRLPRSIEAKLGDHVLQSLKLVGFKASELGDARQRELGDAFDRLRSEAGLPPSVRLVFRDGGAIGANALALPGGTIVLTDQLVKLMKIDEPILGVLAHELGHVQHRHSLRTVLQNSVIALVSMAVLGDASSISGVAVTVPTMLVHTGYSRQFEREADLYAHSLLARSGISPVAFANALQSLVNSRSTAEDEASRSNESDRANRKRSGFGYFSTHPDTAERIEAALRAAEK